MGPTQGKMRFQFVVDIKKNIFKIARLCNAFCRTFYLVQTLTSRLRTGVSENLAEYVRTLKQFLKASNIFGSSCRANPGSFQKTPLSYFGCLDWNIGITGHTSEYWGMLRNVSFRIVCGRSSLAVNMPVCTCSPTRRLRVQGFCSSCAHDAAY